MNEKSNEVMGWYLGTLPTDMMSVARPCGVLGTHKLHVHVRSCLTLPFESLEVLSGNVRLWRVRGTSLRLRVT